MLICLFLLKTYVGKFLETFAEYPPRQKAASFGLDQVMEKLSREPQQVDID